MSKSDLQLEFNGISIQWTADGKISVLDAICAITESKQSYRLWERLVSDHPEILGYCEAHSFQGGNKKWVVDVHGWEKIFMLLPEYLTGG